jgi:hypothetical protein
VRRSVRPPPRCDSGLRSAGGYVARVNSPRHRPDVPEPARLVEGSDLAGRLERWAADARVVEAARMRSRERWLRLQAEEESTVTGVLADLLEAGLPVTLHTRSGGRHGGAIRAVGADFVAMGPEGGRSPGSEVVVALAAIASVCPRPGAADVLGDRPVVGRLRLAEVMAGLAADRSPVRVVTVDAGAITGIVRSVGQDVAVVRGAGDRAGTAYVPFAAISEIVVGE